VSWQFPVGMSVSIVIVSMSIMVMAMSIVIVTIMIVAMLGLGIFLRATPGKRRQAKTAQSKQGDNVSEFHFSYRQ